MRKFIKSFLILLLILLVVYLLGPDPDNPKYSLALPVVPDSTTMDEFVQKEETAHKLKPDNEARIVWFDSAKRKTPYSIVYLHGFSASQEEGDPVHINTARKFGCNLYLSRLAEHGIDTLDPLINLTADKYWESAKRALAIGKHLGHKVIIMATSTGGTLALKLAAAFPGDVSALMLLSPNVKIFDKNAWLLNNPWGLQLAQAITGSKYVLSKDQRPIYRQYWNWNYPLESVVQLQELLETSMTSENFKKVHQPTLMLYYYKDEVHQDSVVNVAAMKDMFEELSTPKERKRSIAMPETGNHVIGSYIKSRDVEGVEREGVKFLEEIVGLKKIPG